MSAAGLFRFAYYAYLSQPSSERILYRLIRRCRSRSIVELGLGDARRAKRLVEVALRFADAESVRYTGIDLFEMRSDPSSGLPLKQAYHQLRPLGAQIRLTPGDPYSALARTANSLTGTDLLVISADQDANSLAQAWFYVPRMLHSSSQVFIEEAIDEQQSVYRRLTSDAIAELANEHRRQVRRAA